MTSALTTFQQWLLFNCTVLVTGCVAWRLQVMPGAQRALAAADGRAFRVMERRVASLSVGIAGLLVVAWFLRGVVQVLGFRDPFAPLRDDISLLLFETFWGTVWMIQGVVIMLLGGALYGARRRAAALVSSTFPDARAGLGTGWAMATVLVVALGVTITLSGHAVGADHARGLAVTADAVHTLAGGMWMGTLAVILTAGRTPGVASPAIFAAQIHRFSPMALVAGVALVAMGVVLSWTHLEAVSNLWSLPYGRLLSAKVGVASLIFGLGFWNWKKGLPDLDTVGGAASVRRRAAWEVSLAVGVIFVTAMLVHAPKP